jgi:hypothetical protein
MTFDDPRQARNSAIERAERYSPFLREAMAALPDVTAAFRDQGGQAAAA